MTIFGKRFEITAGTYALRIKASFPGKVSGDGYKDFTVDVEFDACNIAKLTIDPSVKNLFPTEYTAGTSQIDVTIDPSLITSDYTGPCNDIKFFMRYNTTADP